MAKSHHHYFDKNSGLCSLFLIGVLVRRLQMLLLISLSLVITSCDSKPSLIAYSGQTMGTEYVIKVLQDSEIDSDNIDRAIKAKLADINQSMSTYIADSEISQFNKSNSTQGFVISEPLHQVVAESLAIAKLTNGAFDITVAPAINRWGFDVDGRIIKQPSDEELSEMRSYIGFNYLELGDQLLTKTNPKTTINLSAIAKGYAVDQIAELLISFGIEDFLVNIGGELRAKGKNQQQQIWQVGIEKPEMFGGVQSVFALNNQSVATSGDYRNFITIDGQKFSHAINPVTLKPIFHRLTSVSVLSEKASTADALATALLVMGEEQAYQFALQQNLSVLLIIRDDQSDYIVKRTGKFLELTD